MKPRHSLPLLLLALTLIGCASIPFEGIDAALRKNDYPALLKLLAKSEDDYGSKARLLFHFDRAMALHLRSDFEKSNADVESAHTLIEELYTKSLSTEAAAFLSNDMALPYAGEHFERVAIHVLGLLNFALLGQTDSALVEARRADAEFKTHAQAVGEDKVAYNEDALARYLSALLYENEGGQARWDAYLDLKKCLQASEAYERHYGTPVPRLVGQELLRLAAKLGEKDDLKAFEARFEGLEAAPRLPGEGSVVVLLFEGLAPAKVSRYVQLPIHLSDGTKQFFQVAFPDFERSRNSRESARVSCGEKHADLELMQDWESIALRDLKDRVGLMTVKAIARATVKFQAARALQNEARKSGPGAELLAVLGTNIYALATENADIRSWRTLPARVHVARLNLPAGSQNVELTLGQGSAERTLSLGPIEIKAGQTALLRSSAY